jgi:membrane dipeptidase
LIFFDSHLDLAWNAVEWKRDLLLEVAEIREAESEVKGVARGRNTVSFPAMRRGRVFFCLGTLLAKRIVLGNPPFVPFETEEDARVAARRQLDYYTEMEQLEVIRLIHDLGSLNDHLAGITSGKDETIGVILSMEGADPVSRTKELSEWYAMGLRVLGPVHYGENQYGFGTGSDGGLKQSGFELLAEMDQLGMILDVTHLTDLAFDQALNLFSGPILASHHNCRALVPGQRQLTDEQISFLVRRDAVIGVALDAWMLEPDWVRGRRELPAAGLTAVVDHIDHICQVAGDCLHVGIGSDLDGGFGTEQSPNDLDTIADLQELVPLLAQRNYSSFEVERIAYRNWVDFFLRASGVVMEEAPH